MKSYGGMEVLLHHSPDSCYMLRCSLIGATYCENVVLVPVALVLVYMALCAAICCHDF
jgi:hypothetical protein